MSRAVTQLRLPRAAFGLFAAAAVVVFLLVSPSGPAIALVYGLLSVALAALPAGLTWYFSFSRRATILVFCLALVFIVAGGALFASGSRRNQPGAPAAPAGTR
jgi:hypothetical protein